MNKITMSLVLVLSSIAGTANASSLYPKCLAQLELAAASQFSRGAKLEQSMTPLKYESSKIEVLGGRFVNNGGRFEVEGVFDKETCEVLKLYMIWAD